MEKKLTKLEINALLGFQAREREIQNVLNKLSEEYKEVLYEICERVEIDPLELGTKYSIDTDSGLIKELENG